MLNKQKHFLFQEWSLKSRLYATIITTNSLKHSSKNELSQ